MPGDRLENGVLLREALIALGHKASSSLVPNEQGLFDRGTVSYMAPWLRVFSASDLSQLRHPKSWTPVEGERRKPVHAKNGSSVVLLSEFERDNLKWERVRWGHVRFFRADQIAAWLHEISRPDRERSEALSPGDDRGFTRILRSFYRSWLIPVEDHQLDRLRLLSPRLETVRIEWSELGLAREKRRLALSRRPMSVPMALRGDVVKGIDLVHSPENARSGQSRHLCRGWKIDDLGGLKSDDDPACPCDEALLEIPYRYHTVPRRLMLATSLLSRTVALDIAGPESSAGDWHPPGRKLRVAFRTHGGENHEDAVVVGRSAAARLRSAKVFRKAVETPAMATGVRAANPGDVLQPGMPLLEYVIDESATNPSASLGSGRVTYRLPQEGVLQETEVLAVQRREATSAITSALYVFQLRERNELQVGDKLSTWHGIKGVVARIRDDEKMPVLEDEQRAEIVLSPLGIARRGAFGQFQEARDSTAASADDKPPREGTIFVSRQPQDAAPRCRACGANDAARGQRYGEMEFWALMAHRAPNIAAELLSRERSTALWMRREMERGCDNSKQAALQALNRYLALLGVRLRSGMFELIEPLEEQTIRVGATCERVIRIDGTAAAKKAVREINESRRSETPFSVKLPQPVTIEIPLGGGRSCRLLFDAIDVLPSWLRPGIERSVHPLTELYGMLFTTLGLGTLESAERGLRRRYYFGQLSLAELLREILYVAFDERARFVGGAGAFLRREVLGRRLTRSGRAVIVPDASLRLDTVKLPRDFESKLFSESTKKEDRLVLLNRNPTLHRRGLLALKPEFCDGDERVIRLPLGILKNMNADFDGDQATVVGLETSAALDEAQRLMPGFMDSEDTSFNLRVDPFRPGAPAFATLKELNPLPDESALANDRSMDRNRWVDEYQNRLATKIKEVDDAAFGWDIAMMDEELKRHDRYWRGWTADDWHADEEHHRQMRSVAEQVPLKSRYGGIFRQELYRRGAATPEKFFASIEALGAITERATQAALIVKHGTNAVGLRQAELFGGPGGSLADEDPRREILLKLDPDRPFDAVRLMEALGPRVSPADLFAWMQSPKLKRLLRLVLKNEKGPAAGADDPRWAWFLEDCKPVGSSTDPGPLGVTPG